MEKKIHAIITDENRFIGESLFDLVSKNYNAEISQAVTSHETIRLLSTQHADLLLLDFPMQHGDAFKVIEHLRKFALETPVIVLTAYDQEAMIFNLLRLNVHAILFKKLINHQEVCQAINAVLEQKHYYHEKVRFALQEKPNGIHQPPRIILSNREYQVIELLSEGKHTKEIADLLFLSGHTIEGYRKSLLKKTQTRNTTQLIAYSLRNGIISYT